MIHVSDISRTLALLERIHALSTTEWRWLSPRVIGQLQAEACYCKINLEIVLRHATLPVQPAPATN